MLETIKNIIKRIIARFLVRVVPRGVFCDHRLFNIWQSHGYHIMPVHFYNPVPDTLELEKDVWTRRSELVGVDMNVSKQLEILSEFGAHYKSEYELLHSLGAGTPDWGVLYCMIRHFKPRRIIEIGSGASTAVSAMAVERNRKEMGIAASLIAIEPHPSQELIDGFPGLSELKSMPVQDVPLTEFQQLGENDILFIDSSHILKIGSDVQYEYLEIIPRLKNGVIVHIHDIFFPYEYPREWVMDRSIFWNEAYILQAFLAFNSAFEVIWSSSYLHHHHPGALQQAFSRYHPQNGVPSSFYMRRTKDK
jgi:Methyltransferase domain